MSRVETDEAREHRIDVEIVGDWLYWSEKGYQF